LEIYWWLSISIDPFLILYSMHSLYGVWFYFTLNTFVLLTFQTRISSPSKNRNWLIFLVRNIESTSVFKWITIFLTRLMVKMKIVTINSWDIIILRNNFKDLIFVLISI
jgi:hypothetical protein